MYLRGYFACPWFASVDVVESKLQNQIKKHNEKANIGMDKHQKTKTRRALGKLFSRRQKPDIS